MNWMQERAIWIQNNLLREFPARARYLIGVSGGRDSVALLHQLFAAGYRELTICHFNHRLRGRSSDADEKFVEKLAEQHNCDLAVGSADVARLAAQNKMSVETSARAARYQFFAQVAEATDCHAIFLAHHADDLVETFLINLFRGAGLSGLGAIRQISNHRIGETDLTVVRPLVGIWRSDIDRYVRSHRLKFREDASNKDLGPLRNRVRRRVIPYLEKMFGRNIRQNIWRTAMIATDEESFFDTILPKLDHTALAVAPLRKMSVAVQRRMLRKWLQAAGVQDIGFEVIERVRSLLESENRVAKTNLRGDRHVRRKAGKIFIEQV
jgi:tRNA(Ile)-lysidine synthase